MAIQKVAGFDNDNLSMFTIVNGGSSGVSTVQARTGTKSLRIQSSGISAQTQATISYNAALATGFVYVAYYINQPLVASSLFIDILDGSTVHMRLNIKANGNWELYRGAGTTLLATGTSTYTTQTWAQAAIKFTIADSGGICQVRHNGSTTNDINFSGDTRNAGNASATGARFMSPAVGSGIAYLDDVILQDTIVQTVAVPNDDWLGDKELMYKFPNGAGSHNDFTIAGSAPAATAWESLDDVTPDDGVTDIESNTVGHKTSVAFEDIVNTAVTIVAVVSEIRAQKASAAAREVRSFAERGGNTVNGITHTLTTSWLNFQTVMATDSAGIQWTGANFNSTEFGSEVVT